MYSVYICLPRNEVSLLVFVCFLFSFGAVKTKGHLTSRISPEMVGL